MTFYESLACHVILAIGLHEHEHREVSRTSLSLLVHILFHLLPLHALDVGAARHPLKFFGDILDACRDLLYGLVSQIALIAFYAGLLVGYDGAIVNIC